MKLNRFFVLAVTGFACLPTGPSQADEQPSVLGEVVVTAAGYVQPVEKVIPSVIIIDRETIERSGSADIAGLLRWHAGLDIARSGGFGQQASVFIRGMNSNHAAVLVNGVKMNSATTGSAALPILDVSHVERIEIIKGPRSTIYGSEAMGGVINIITTAQEPQKKAELHLSNGRYSTIEQGIDLSYGNDYMAGRFSFNRFDTDGFPATVTSATDHGYDNNTYSLDVNTRSKLGELVLNYWQATGNTEYSNFGNDVDQDHKNEVLSATYSMFLSDSWETFFSFSKVKDELHQNQINLFSNGKDFAFTNRTVYDWRNDLSIGDNVLAFGISSANEDTESLSYGTGYKEDTDIWSVYVRDQWIKDRHSLFASARYIDHENFDEAATWNFEYGYNLTDTTKLSAGIGTGFRAPDSNVRFGFGGNPDLREETSRSIEMGISHAFSPRTRLSLRVFENKVEDLIAYAGTYPSGMNRNVDKARIQGVELSLQHQYRQWEAYLEGIMQNPRNETDDVTLLRRAKRTVTGALTYHHEAFFATLQGLFTSQRRDFGDITMSGYGLVNLSAGVDFPYATLSLKVDNLFDKDYELVSGYNTPGLSLFAELRFRFVE